MSRVDIGDSRAAANWRKPLDSELREGGGVFYSDPVDVLP